MVTFVSPAELCVEVSLAFRATIVCVLLGSSDRVLQPAGDGDA